MAEKFDHLLCPICGSDLVYSEGTHDLGCENNPKPLDFSIKKRENSFHEAPVSYGSTNKTDISSGEAKPSEKIKTVRLCNTKKNKSDSNISNACGVSDEMIASNIANAEPEYCVFGISFTDSAHNGTLWSIRIIDGQTDYSALMRLMQDIERRGSNKEPLASNVPNLPKKVERSTASKLAFRYNLEIEDLYSIKYSTETIERLALFYDLKEKEIRHIKQSDVMVD